MIVNHREPALQITTHHRYAAALAGHPVGDAAAAAPSRAEPASRASAQPEQARVLAAMRARDGEVRSHEQAHQAAGGPHVSGGMRLSYQRGPDGRYYAVGGEVGISTSPVPGDPEATLRKMETVRRAALAPAEPSAQDLRVAARAAVAASQARLELARERAEGDAGDPQAAGGAALDPQLPAIRAYGQIAKTTGQDAVGLLDLRA